MARPDKVTARFRGVVAANLTGVFGDATTPDLICVDIDASGQLVAAGAAAVKGVIWTPEGKASTDVANYNVALAGSVMTVFQIAEIVDTEFSAGDEVFSAAAGDVTTTGPGQMVGFVVDSDEGSDRLILNVTGGA
jgi:hypothetical protein